MTQLMTTFTLINFNIPKLNIVRFQKCSFFEKAIKIVKSYEKKNGKNIIYFKCDAESEPAGSLLSAIFHCWNWGTINFPCDLLQ